MAKKNLNLFLNNLDRATKKKRCHMTSEKTVGKIRETKQTEGQRIWWVTLINSKKEVIKKNAQQGKIEYVLKTHRL